ncbi:AAA family ATPase [Leifsonia sp. Le1]|uniref:AAA family ATPase n=1 Tax=Leifsonia sp. Le1 TaxID=3404918 RepID=UPI003EB75842
MRIVAVLNQKGGVGKSNVVMNLAAVTADHSRVLVVDTDHLQRTASDWAETAEKNERPLPFDFTDEGDPALLARMREAGAYDTIFVDTPGSLYESDLLAAVLDSADFVVLPMEPQPASVKPILRTIKSFVEPRNLPYRVLLSRVKRDAAGERRRDDAIAGLDAMGIPRFNSVIRDYVAHSDAPMTGDVVTTYPTTRNTSLAIDDFKSLALEMTTIWANGGSK